MDNINTIISNNLVLLRKKAKYTQVYVANTLKYSDKTISKWETGELVPSVENLMQLCELYNVTLDTITRPINEDVYCKVNDYSKRNKLIISLLAIIAVWIIMTLVFVYAKIIADYDAWKAFLWAIPLSCVVGIIFNSLWGKNKYNFLLISFFVWSIIACIYLQYIQYNLIPIFFIGIPVQIAIILWSGLKRNKRDK